MGYSEIHCFICGVSFTIARFRTRSDPRAHAWDRGDGGEYCCEGSDDCSEATGCSFVDRNKETDEFLPIDTYLDTAGCTRDASNLEHIAGPGCDGWPGYNGHYVSGQDIGMSRTAQCILRKNPADDPEYGPPDHDNPLWQPAQDDEPWESTSAWFLSGLNTRIEERHIAASAGWRPVRHGAVEFDPDDAIYAHDRRGIRMALIFHPRCMEIYQRASVAKTGKVDIDGLGEWWERRNKLGEPDWRTRCMGMNQCDQQWWICLEGTEMFTVDPLKDGKMMKVLREAAVWSGDFDPSDSAFPTRNNTATPAATNNGNNGGNATVDPFLALPAELSQQILSYLPNSSVAAMRASSRAFTHIPISFFYPLVRTEFPWIWEANSEVSTALPMYSKWTQKALEIAFYRTPRYYEYDDRDDEGNHDGNNRNEQYDDLPEDIKSSIARPEQFKNVVDDGYLQPPLLPRLQTNWFKLYAALKKHGRSVPGLREDRELDWNDEFGAAVRHHEDSIPGLWNRERIWRDCMEILRKIEVMRAKDREVEGWL